MTQNPTTPEQRSPYRGAGLGPPPCVGAVIKLGNAVAEALAKGGQAGEVRDDRTKETR